MIIADRLPCGVQVVCEETADAQAACIGIWIGAGSSRETPGQAGISHFIEHMFFKGTEKRTAREIARDTDNIGASVNAFTGKEATCYHMKALTEKFPEAVEILLDMLCHSVFDPREIQKERGVILEEMQMIQDTPDDYIIDLLTGTVLRDTDLASSIIGTRTSLRKLGRSQILSYIRGQYARDNIVVSVVGNFDRQALFEQLEEALSGLPPWKEQTPESALPEGRRFLSKVKDVGQTHLAIGQPGVSLSSELYYAQAIVNDVLGGSMSSRLFQSIREDRGLAYTVYSAGSSYIRTGMYYIYAGVGIGKEEETLNAIAVELKQLQKEMLTAEETDIVKQRLKSGYIFSLESMNSRMYRLGKNMLLLGRYYTPEEVMADIDGVTRDQIAEVCRMVGDLSAYSGVAISKEKLDLQKFMIHSQAAGYE
jgi:predicted Zn-dependent peptidase